MSTEPQNNTKYLPLVKTLCLHDCDFQNKIVLMLYVINKVVIIMSFSMFCASNIAHSQHTHTHAKKEKKKKREKKKDRDRDRETETERDRERQRRSERQTDRDRI